jgi:hypothetical protein
LPETPGDADCAHDFLPWNNLRRDQTARLSPDWSASSLTRFISLGVNPMESVLLRLFVSGFLGCDMV